jgi:hypothetical protein
VHQQHRALIKPSRAILMVMMMVNFAFCRGVGDDACWQIVPVMYSLHFILVDVSDQFVKIKEAAI